MIPSDNCRIESDFLGEIKIPAGALYGVNAARAVENFASSGKRMGDEPALPRAFALIKMAAAAANHEFGLLPEDIFSALTAACREVVEGKHHEHFIVDLLEGSGGTSYNMNVNEVLANRTLVLLGDTPGNYLRVHPNDHVNLSQSTNDVVPSAIKLACRELLRDLLEAMRGLEKSLREKQEEFGNVLRLGRTCLQEAQPMTLGQAFGGYASLVGRLHAKLAQYLDELQDLPLGGTAIGTGLGSPEGYRQSVLHQLSKITGTEWREPADAFDAMQNMDAFARLSGELKTTAVSLAKIGSDLIILSSGPAGGIGELRLPPLQAGSSIMPGKVNPVQPMALCQASMLIAGYDVSVAMAAQQGQLEVNHFEPVIAHCLFSSLRLLTEEIRLFSRKCVDGITADENRCRNNLKDSSAIATAIVPKLGYEKTAGLVRKSIREGKRFSDMIVGEGIVSGETLDLLIAQSTRQGRS